MAANETVITAGLTAAVTVFTMWVTNRTTARNSDTSNATTANKNLDDAQQKLLETAISERDKAVSERHILEKRIQEIEDRYESKIIGLRVEIDVWRDREQRAADSIIILKQELAAQKVVLTAIETQSNMIGMAEDVKRIEGK